MKYAIIGGGFGGLAAAYELAKSGKDVTLFERTNQLGGLASTFNVGNQELEKFYHHWLGTDQHIFDLASEIGHGEKLLFKESKVGIYFSNKSFRFSSPFDLIKFTPLPFLSRIRFGLSILYAWTIRDMEPLEKTSAEEWLIKVAGLKAYQTIWQPLLIGKFGEDYYKQVAAVWIWNKLVQRGMSRDASAKEKLGYYKGGFSAFIDDLQKASTDAGLKLRTEVEVTKIIPNDDNSITLIAGNNSVQFDKVLYTGHTPEFAELVELSGFDKYAAELRKVTYLANICLILETNKSLSDIYWLNVNDPSFPFVAIIEHTNFESKELYDGNHLIYLSKYLPTSHDLYKMDDSELFEFALPHLKRMFPKFDESCILRHFTWRAEYAQPIIVKQYRDIIPSTRTPIPNLFLSTMAQVYPQDRGTNYAVSHGREISRQMME